MSRVVPISKTETIYFSSYDSVDKSYYSLSNASKAYGYTVSSYCGVTLTQGANAYTYVYFKFDTSSIPQDAEIVSVACTTRVSISNQTAANVASKGAKVCSGTTEKTAAVSVTTTVANRTFTMGDWTRAELNDVRIKYYATRGTSNTSTAYTLRIYAGTLTVNYTVDGILYTVTCSSSARGVTGSPASQEVDEGQDATVTISGDLTDVTVTDNNVDVTSELIAVGDDHTYTIQSLDADHVILISGGVQGQEIFVKQNGSWVAVDMVYVKQSGTWKEVETLSIKQNGSWVN